MPAVAVIDTNVLVGALLGPLGPNRSVVRACFAGHIDPILTDSLFAEYRDVWGRPDVWVRCRIDRDRRQTFLEAFVSRCRWVRVRYRWRPNLRDESDNHLVDLAVAGRAAYIVTNNLRDFAGGELKFPSIRAIGPGEIMQELGHDDGNGRSVG